MLCRNLDKQKRGVLLGFELFHGGFEVCVVVLHDGLEESMPPRSHSPVLFGKQSLDDGVSKHGLIAVVQIFIESSVLMAES